MTISEQCAAIERIADKRHARLMREGYAEAEAAAVVSKFLRNMAGEHRAKEWFASAHFADRIAEAYEVRLGVKNAQLDK